MNILNIFFYGTTVGLMALGTTTNISEFNVRTQPPVSVSTVKLGTAAGFAVLSEWGISNTGVTYITGDIGVSPGEETSIRGFDLESTAFGTSSKSVFISRKVYAANHNRPTPTILTAAIMDMLTAYTDALGRVADVAGLGEGNIGGTTIPPGVYKWNSDLVINGDITLTGDSQDVWIFQIAQTLNMSPSKKVILSGGAQTKNIFWQVTGGTTIGENSTFIGNILGKGDITMQKDATLDGRAMTQTRVSLDNNTIK